MTFPDIEDKSPNGPSIPIPRRFIMDENGKAVGTGIRFPDGQIVVQWSPLEGDDHLHEDELRGIMYPFTWPNLETFMHQDRKQTLSWVD